MATHAHTETQSVELYCIYNVWMGGKNFKTGLVDL